MSLAGATTTTADARARCAARGAGPVLEDAADYVVVGSGAAGATAARRLARAGKDVLLLEEGPPFEPVPLDEDITVALRRYFRDHGSTFLQGRSFIPVLQGRCVGGSTAINSAITWRMPEDVYPQWARDPGVGAAFAQPAMEAQFEDLERALGIRPVDRAVLGRNNSLMEAGAHALGFGGHVIERNEHGCRGSSRCLHGCPHGAKQSMNLSFVPDALHHGARLWAGCAARRIVRPEGGGRGWVIEGTFRDFSERRPAGPQGVFEEWGPAVRVHARRAVLVAASALQTPCLLRRSGLEGGARLAGDHFTCHPGAALGGVFDEPVKMWEGATQGWETVHFRQRRFKLEAIALPPALLAARLPGAGATLVEAVREMGHVAMWGVQVRSRAEGRVRPLGKNGFVARFTPNAEDMAALREALRVMAEMMFAAGARAILPGVHGLPARLGPDQMDLLEPARLPADPRAYNIIATHLFGTARMGSDASLSVVSPALEHHDAPGVYVLDSSVFPTNLGVNPQHCIMAVASIAVDRIIDRD